MASDAGKAAPLAVLLVILALSTALYALPGENPHTPATSTAVTAGSGAGEAGEEGTEAPDSLQQNAGNTQASQPLADTEESTATQCPLRGRITSVAVEDNTTKIVIDASLPNPCYSLTVVNVSVANYQVVIYANITVPPSGSMCIQRLQPAPFTLSLEGLEPGANYTLVVEATLSDGGTCKSTLGVIRAPGGQ